MKSPQIENIVVDEIRDLTYVVMAQRTLTDGEVYKAIRVELLKRATPFTKGERVIINSDGV